MTAPSILRAWRADAIGRIEARAASLAEDRPELAEKARALREVRGRDPMHEEAYRLMALADLVEAMDAATGSADSLEDKTVAELKREADSEGIQYPANAKRDALIAVVREKRGE